MILTPLPGVCPFGIIYTQNIAPFLPTSNCFLCTMFWRIRIYNLIMFVKHSNLTFRLHLQYIFYDIFIPVPANKIKIRNVLVLLAVYLAYIWDFQNF